MNELRVDIGGSNRGFTIATEETKRIARDCQRSLSGYTPDSFKGAQMMRDQYGKAFDEIKGPQGMGGLLQQIAGGFGQAGAAVMQLATGPIGVATVALTAMYEGAKKVWAIMHESFQLTRDAQMLGMSTTGLQRLNLANAQQGFDPGEAQGRMSRFSNKVGEAAAGDKGALNVFKDAGVEINGKTMEEILNQVAEAFDRIKDPAERAHMAVQLFGRGGQEMIPILQQLKSGGGWLGGVVSDEQTDALLGGQWKKIHGFWEKVKSLGAAGGKNLLSRMMSSPWDEEIKLKPPPVEKVTVRESDADKEAKVKAAAKAVKDLAEAQKEYHRELEATANPEGRLVMEMLDRDELERALKKAKAAHDEVEVLKIKTELLAKNKQIEDVTKGLRAESALAAAMPREQHRAAREQIDSMSSSGLFQSRGAVMNPTLDSQTGKDQLTTLHAIHGTLLVISAQKIPTPLIPAKDPFAK
jgi:hypothetical protein